MWQARRHLYHSRFFEILPISRSNRHASKLVPILSFIGLASLVACMSPPSGLNLSLDRPTAHNKYRVAVHLLADLTTINKMHAWESGCCGTVSRRGAWRAGVAATRHRLSRRPQSTRAGVPLSATLLPPSRQLSAATCAKAANFRRRGGIGGRLRGRNRRRSGSGSERHRSRRAT